MVDRLECGSEGVWVWGEDVGLCDAEKFEVMRIQLFILLVRAAYT
jgi:hypothetical protein